MRSDLQLQKITHAPFLFQCNSVNFDKMKELNGVKFYLIDSHQMGDVIHKRMENESQCISISN